MSENSIHPAGILCLQSYQLGKKDQERLADALQQRALHACPDPALTVPGTAVLWMGVPVDAIAEQNNVSVQPTTCRLTCTLIRILHIPLKPHQKHFGHLRVLQQLVHLLQKDQI